MIGKRVSHYIVLEKLGEGGMGVVYKAEDTRLKRHVALKFLRPDLTRDDEAKLRFIAEAQAASALEHPNICNIHQIDETTDGQLFICMACYEGATVKTKLESGPLEWQEAVRITAQTLEGLARAHACGMVHRDIKPANIMVTPHGDVKILDFGVAKLSGHTRLTRRGMSTGTAAYMSPEQAQGEDVDQRTDIWSLGVSLYEMVTGMVPFKAEYEPAVVYAILHETPKPVSAVRSGVPTELERVIDRAMRKNAGERYRRAEDMLADLKALLASTQAPGPGTQVAAGAPAAAETRSIAVLPLKSLSANKEDEYFSDGMTEDILTQLSKMKGLRVISRQSVMQYKNSDKPLRDIGRELDVAVVLEGSVRRAGERVRIVAQLIDAQTDKHLWAETYDRDMKDVFAIQSEVAQNIAAALKVHLSPEEKERIEAKPTEDLTAYDCYLKGREYYYRYRKQDNEAAISLFKRALELDPRFALAYAGLSDAYSQAVTRFGREDELIDRAVEAGQKAIVLDPNLAEAYKALGLAGFARGMMGGSLEMCMKAVELNPSYFPAVANIGVVYANTGRYAEALPWFRKCISLAPTSGPLSQFYIGLIYSRLSKYTEAELWLNKAATLQPDYLDSYSITLYIHLARGETERALAIGKEILAKRPGETDALCLAADTEFFGGRYEEAEVHYRSIPDTNPTAWFFVSDVTGPVHLGYIYQKTGRQAEARELLGKFVAGLQAHIAQGSELPSIPYNMAAACAVQGKSEDALVWLRKAIDGGIREYALAQMDPVFENLRDDERFKQMMSEVKGMLDEMRARIDSE